jgi:MFS transporter, UMF1 family
MTWLRAKLGLQRPETFAWALYDWANSVFMTTVLALFPIYFARVAANGLSPAEASRRFTLATLAAMVCIALLAPLLGAMADYGRLKKPLLAAFIGLGTLTTAGLFFVGQGQWQLGMVLFALANMGVSGSIVFNDSLLPHVASAGEVDRVTSSAFALGYLGGSLLFGLNVLWIQYPAWFGLHDASDAMRWSFLSAGVWWLVFALPVLIKVPEPQRQLEPGEPVGLALIPAAFTRLGETFHELRGYKQTFLFLLAFLIYSDGVSTIIRLGTMYGAEIGIQTPTLIKAVLLANLIGVPCSVAFGWLAGRIGPKRAILFALGVYAFIAVLGYAMTTDLHFYALCTLVGLVQGGSQALSKSLFATLVPKHRTSEFFGFFGVFEKFGGVGGPLLFTAVIGVTGSGRGAILGLIAFFVVGALLLLAVDVPAGQHAARTAEERAGAVPLPDARIPA